MKKLFLAIPAVYGILIHFSAITLLLLNYKGMTHLDGFLTKVMHSYAIAAIVAMFGIYFFFFVGKKHYSTLISFTKRLFMAFLISCVYAQGLMLGIMMGQKWALTYFVFSLGFSILILPIKWFGQSYRLNQAATY